MLVLLSTSSCGGSANPTETTQAVIRRVHGALGQFQQSHGRLPSTLTEVCESAVNPCLLLEGRVWIADGWDQPVLFKAMSDGYELRSLGPDGIENTNDDLVFSSEAELGEVRRVAGCYRLESRWDRLASRDVVLDTILEASGEYRLTPSATNARAFWLPRPESSVLMVWTDGLSGIGALFHVDGDLLRGSAAPFTDMRLVPSRRRAVLGRRIPCTVPTGY